MEIKHLITASRQLPPCGARKMLRAYADPCIFRLLRKLLLPFLCRRQREAVIPLEGKPNQAVAEMRQLAAHWGYSVENSVYTQYNEMVMTRKNDTQEESNMSDPGDFIIENGVLKQYKGPGGDVVIPDGVTSIGSWAFRGCSKLRSVTIPDSVTSIGVEAFYGCSSLTGVTIPDSVTSIGGGAFRDCKSLASVTIPDSVTSIGSGAFLGCNALPTDSNGFIIVGGLLVAFRGTEALVTIPDSVTSIGDGAFEGCKGLTSVVIPGSVTVIGKGALRSCENLTELMIPEGVVRISSEAFAYCKSLTSVTIPASLASIEGDSYWGAFYECKELKKVHVNDLGSWCRISFGGATSNPLYYAGNLYVNGKLEKELVIPDGIERLGNYAFYGCSISSLTVPKGVTSIGDWTFSYCSSLQKMSILEESVEFGYGVFADCPKLERISLPKEIRKLGTDPFGSHLPLGLVQELASFQYALTDSQFRDYLLQKDMWKRLGPAQQAEAFLSRTSLREPMKSLITEAQALEIGNAIHSGWDKKAGIKQCNGLGDFLRLCFRKLPKSLMETLYQDLKESKNGKKAVGILESDSVIMEKLAPAEQQEGWPAETLVYSQMAQAEIGMVALDKLLRSQLGLNTSLLPELRDQDGRTLSPCVLSWLMLHGAGTVGGKNSRMPGPLPGVEDVLALIEQDSLQQALAALFGIAAEYELLVCRPICRYADQETLQKIAKQAQGADREIKDHFYDSCAYNDTALALKLCEKAGKLSEYAWLRGLKADDVRDSLVLPGLGLDDEGKKTYDLGGKTVHIRLEQNLSFSIYDDNTGKTVKSIPKSKADPVKVEEAKTDLNYLKTTVKEVVRRKTKILFQAFLNGSCIPFDEWKSLYLGSEVMRSLARLIIWQQGEATFTLSGREAVFANGQPYSLTEAPIYVSYPTEMNQEDIDAWQKYFARRDLKQPFLQIWEPVISPSSISQDRYRDIMIPFYRFKDQDRHGIHVEDTDYHKYVTIKFDDCKTKVNRIDNWRHQLRIEDRFEVWGFGFEKYTRQVNHVVSLLDKWTVEDRVRKDDVSVMDQIGRFTLAQVTEMIQAAQEAQAVNVLALLLEYKNAHFADFDPMDEFTLEW